MTIYSQYDTKVIRKASQMGMPLIGGTALEVIADIYNKKDCRQRSKNDIDFISDKQNAVNEFSDWCRRRTNPDIISVDVMLITSHTIPSELVINANYILVMAPEYLVWSKLCRNLTRDYIDIKWLLNICNVDKLEFWLNRLGTTETEIKKLNNLIQMRL